MKLLDFAWSTFCSVSGADQTRFRLILSETSLRPTMGADREGYVVKLPAPRRVREGIVSIQGLFTDADEQGWPMLWRLFKASIYHAAFHVKHPGFKVYSPWAKGKDEFAAICTISLLEDYRVTFMGKREWPGVMGDIAFANYVGAIRMTPPDDIENRGLRLASKLLLSMWGVSPKTSERVDEDRDVLALAERVRGVVESSVESPSETMLLKAADLVYKAFERTVLSQIPSFPHTEAHSRDSLFGDHLLERSGGDARRLSGALSALGVMSLGGEDENVKAETRDALQGLAEADAQKQKLSAFYLRMSAGTKLTGVSFPQGDYSYFLRTRAELAGPIRNIRNHILTTKNTTDEEQGKESGQVDMPVVMQVVASRSERTDVFVREEPVMKDEAWAVLVDSSKSVSTSTMQIRGIATCLAEVAQGVMRQSSRWALYGFNDSFQVVKDFGENYSIETKSRIGGLTQQGATLLPDALITAARALGTQPAENKYLVVVSDCLPTGYSGVEEELASQIQTVSKSGTLLIGVGVQSSAIKKYFKTSSVLTSPYELMKFFVKSYMELSSSS